MYQYKARIVNIVDGDTVDAEVDLGFRLTAKLRLRLLGINAPEMRSKDEARCLKALEARSTLSALILEATVVIETQKPDAFGRYLANIWLRDININEEMIRLGMAEAY